MTIINTTPDSFSDGGRNYNLQNAIDNSLKAIDTGTDILDIGGESTRPGAKPVSLDDEIDRTIPLIKEIRKQDKLVKISIDTTKYEVAKLALEEGASIINDISGLRFEPRFVDLADEYNAELVIMHIQGEPRNMQNNPQYDNVVEDVYSFLENQYRLTVGKVDNVYVDVGIGFGKTVKHNFELIRNIEKFNDISGKQLLGISRKSFLAKTLNIDENANRDLATVIVHTMLLNKRLDIIRVHNTKAMSMLKILSEELS